MRSFSSISFCAILALAGGHLASAQELPARLNMRKGSIIIGSISNKVEKVPIQTSYGRLEVPVSEIKSIKFGLHYEPGQKEALLKAVSQLGDSDFKARDRAVSFLVNGGRHSLPLLPHKTDDLEVSKRVKTLQAEITTKNKEEIPTYDTIVAAAFDIKGQVLLESIEIVPNDKEFGVITVKVVNIFNLYTEKMVGNIDFSVQADGNWHDTNLFIESAFRLKIQASGQVDLWPQTAGQYMSGPNGGSNAGMGKTNKWLSGALIGKIGQNGEEFLLGENFSGSLKSGANLYLKINESPWNSASSGNYLVNVRPE